MCVQFLESIVLDACEIVYEQALVQPYSKIENEGVQPFMYWDQDYNYGFLIADIVLLAVRSVVTFVSAVLYCPDYFEYAIGGFEKGFYLSSSNPEWAMIRRSIDLGGQYVVGLMVVV